MDERAGDVIRAVEAMQGNHARQGQEGDERGECAPEQRSSREPLA